MADKIALVHVDAVVLTVRRTRVAVGCFESLAVLRMTSMVFSMVGLVLAIEMAPAEWHSLVKETRVRIISDIRSK